MGGGGGGGLPGKGNNGQPVAQMTPKISISDAFSLISLRLGRVEDLLSQVDFDSLMNGMTGGGMGYGGGGGGGCGGGGGFSSDGVSCGTGSDNGVMMQHYDDLFDTIHGQFKQVEGDVEASRRREEELSKKYEIMSERQLLAASEIRQLREATQSLSSTLASIRDDMAREISDLQSEFARLEVAQNHFDGFLQQLTSQLTPDQMMKVAADFGMENEIISGDDASDPRLETQEESGIMSASVSLLTTAVEDTL